MWDRDHWAGTGSRCVWGPPSTTLCLCLSTHWEAPEPRVEHLQQADEQMAMGSYSLGPFSSCLGAPIPRLFRRTESMQWMVNVADRSACTQRPGWARGERSDKHVRSTVVPLVGS